MAAGITESMGLPTGLVPMSAGLVPTGGTSDKALSADAHLSNVSTETGERTSAPDSRSVSPELGQPTASAVEPAEDSEFDPRNTNLNHFHGAAMFEQGISGGEFTKLKGLSECCRSDGKVELYHWRKVHQAEREGQIVVVKRVVKSRVSVNVGKECNERVVSRGLSQRRAEDTLNEIGVYCYLTRQTDLPQHILRMHTAFSSGNDVWLVLEHANGGDLFAMVQKLKREGSGLSMGQLMTWTWQLLQAVRYLHKHRIGHRDISMENVLLCDGVVRLMDFGQAVQTHSLCGATLRYFTPLGKPYYRPPECHVPPEKLVQVHVPKNARPDEVTFVQTAAGDCLCEVLLPSTALPGQVCSAQPWGYAVTPVDMFACGVCIFIMATGMPPWRQANLTDSHFAWVHQCGISRLLKEWKKPVPAAADELMAFLMRSTPTARPSAEQSLSHYWFEPFLGTDVQLHSASALFHSASTSSHFATSAADAEATAAAGSEAFSHSVMHSSVNVSALESLATLADPYTRDATVRSVAAPPAEIACGLAGFGGAFAGDFYAMQDSSCHWADIINIKELTFERFAKADIPPSVPASSVSLGFEPSTFNVSGKEPAKLGNHLLNFLTMAAGAVVTKVSRRKFTVKAEVDGEAGRCTLKIRIYSLDGDRYAVEFQRRSGESAALHQVFDEAAKHFMAPPKPSRSRKATTKEPTTQPAAVSHMVHPTMPLPLSLPRLQGKRVVRQSVPALHTRPKEVTSKNSAFDDFFNRPSSANPIGSGLNAARWRSKSSSKLLAAGRFNATM